MDDRHDPDADDVTRSRNRVAGAAKGSNKWRRGPESASGRSDMLVLSRKPGEKVVLSNGITLTVVEVRGNRSFDSRLNGEPGVLRP